MTDYYSLTPAELWPLVAGILLPLLVATIKRREWQSGAKAGVLFGCTIVVTTVGELVTGRLTQPHGWQAWTVSAMVVLLIAHTTWQALWRPSGIDDRVMDATSPSQPEPEVPEVDYVPEHAADELTPDQPS